MLTAAQVRGLAPLPADLVLPAPTPEPPWHCRVTAVVWWHRATPAAVQRLPPALRDVRRVPLTVVGLLRYLDSPVGGYAELLASPVLLSVRGPRAVITDIAVDDLVSLAGGRAHWALPKVLARFTGEPAAPPRSVVGDGWSITADGLPGRLPPLPVGLPLGAVHPWPDGRVLRSVTRLSGWARPARVEVASTGVLAGWVRPGRHSGVVLRDARLVVGRPRG